MRAVSFRSIINLLPASIRTHSIPLLLLLLLTVAAYGEVISHSFLINWDDQLYITKNRAVRGFSVDNLKLAFTTNYSGNYAPVQIVSYMFDYSLWELDPRGYFVANMAYHCISGILLYALLLRMVGSTWGAMAAAALFLVHPVQVENVAWLSQRKTLLAMLFYLASFHGYLSYRKNDDRHRWWYTASLLFLCLALLSKSVAVIFPVMLVLYDVFIEHGRLRMRNLFDKLPYFAVALACGVLTLIFQADSHSGGGRIPYPENSLFVIPISMLPVLVTYLRMLVWPDPSSLSVLYFPPWRESVDGTVMLALCIAAGLVIAGWCLFRKDRSALFWYLTFFLGLLPVAQIVPLVTLMNDRYLYFPMLGLSGFVAYTWVRLPERFSVAEWFRCLVVAGVLVIILLLTLVSNMRCRVWKNTITLFSDAVAKYPNEVKTLTGLAEGYVVAGNLNEGRILYETVASKGVLDDDDLANLAKIYLDTGNYALAYKCLETMSPLENRYSRRVVLMGEYLYRIGNLSAAEEWLQSYLKDVPDSVSALYLLGQIYLLNGYYERAADMYYRAVTFGGTNQELFFAFACVESLLGHTDSSLEALQAAFEKGFSAMDLKKGGACLSNIQYDPRYRKLVRQYLGEPSS